MTEKWKRITPQRTARLDKAANCYIERNERADHPSGSFDSGGRWYPCEITEEQDCCGSIRRPSAAYPYSLLTHCRTLRHIASLFDCDPQFLSRQIKKGGSQ